MKDIEIVAVILLAALCGYVVMHFVFRGGKIWKDSTGYNKKKGSKSSKMKSSR
jgi:hypothetical protein